MKKDALIHCPTCKKRFAYFSSEFRPFCAERCKMVDLGHWFEESYAMAGNPSYEGIYSNEEMGGDFSLNSED